jgi:hypothetical protein
MIKKMRRKNTTDALKHLEERSKTSGTANYEQCGGKYARDGGNLNR